MCVRQAAEVDAHSWLVSCQWLLPPPLLIELAEKLNRVEGFKFDAVMLPLFSRTSHEELFASSGLCSFQRFDARVTGLIQERFCRQQTAHNVLTSRSEESRSGGA